MILDIRENLHRYCSLANGFDRAITFLLQPGLADLPSGRHQIDVKEVFAIVAREKGRKRKDALLETHDRYLDIQMIIKGEDTMGWISRLSWVSSPLCLPL